MSPFNSALISSSQVERFRQLIARRTGLAFEDAKLTFLGDVLKRRLETTSLEADSYLAAFELSASPAESGALAQDLTVPETYFFRNINQFRAFAEVALPDRMRARQGRRVLRILSAGCATGEEPYSLSITTREHLADASWDVSIRGLDLNPSVLERAKRARYSTWALRETPADERRWFKPEGRDLLLDEAVCNSVQFEQRNLAQDDASFWQAESFDVIFCRNVMMYFTPENARALVARLAHSLVRGGYLFLGHAETLRGVSQEFHLRHTHGTFYYQRKDANEVREAEPMEFRSIPSPPLAPIIEGSTSWIDAIQQASEKIASLARGPGVVASTPPTPSRPKPDLARALDLLRRERFSEALDVVHELPADSERDHDVLMLEAVLLTHSGKLDQATATCERLLAMDELSAGAHYVLALCREAGGDLAGAGDQDQTAIYLSPTFAMPRLHLGLLARRAGDLHAARRELREARMLLQSEDASRLLLFGGGFGREALIALCTAELSASGDRE